MYFMPGMDIRCQTAGGGERHATVEPMVGSPRVVRPTVESFKVIANRMWPLPTECVR